MIAETMVIHGLMNREWSDFTAISVDLTPRDMGMCLAGLLLLSLQFPGDIAKITPVLDTMQGSVQEYLSGRVDE
jgi:hypothetical protein